MTTFSEFSIFLIYCSLVFFTGLFTFLYFFRPLNWKGYRAFAGLAVFCLVALIVFWVYQYRVKRAEDMEQVGTYYLLNYPNCDSCRVKLHANYTFEVTDNKKIYERGEWFYQSGADYWGVYLNEGYQLGSGIYEYRRYILNYPEK